MSNDAVNDLLSGGGAPALKFPVVGTEHTGTILKSEVAEQRDLEGNTKTFSDGNPMKQIVVTLATNVSDEPGEDGRRRLFVKGQMLTALREATADHDGLEDGGTLTVRYTGNGTSSQRGYSPPKQYAVTYTPPDGHAAANAAGSAPTGYGYEEEPF